MAIYSWGANSHGQLGLGYENELCSIPQKLSRLPFNVSAVKTIKCGGGHALILDNLGILYCCGWNNHGQLGLGNKSGTSEFKPINSEYFNDKPIIDFDCGWNSSAAINADSKLYVWGSNGFHQLGLCERGFSIITKPIELKLPRNENPKKICFGLRFFAVLTDDNKVYVFGKFRIGEVSSYLKLSIIPFNKGEIIKIQSDNTLKMMSCGQNHIILSDGINIMGIGDNKFRQSVSIKFLYHKNISSGWTHNALLTDNKEIYLWGRNTYGQIGCSLNKTFYSYPKKLQLLSNLVPYKIYLGSEHGMIITKNGKILTWGWNEHGNCGNGTTENIYIPEIINIPTKCMLGASGAGFCYALCEI